MTALRQRMREDMQVSESFAARATRLHRERRPVRTALRAFAGGLGPEEIRTYIFCYLVI
jgi:hypothetical protein